MIIDSTCEEFLTEGFKLLEHPVYNIRVFFYRVSKAAMTARLRRTAVGKPGLDRYMEMSSIHHAGSSECSISFCNAS
jgi:hypothetical protein